MTCSVTINSGTTLTVSAGTVVKFSPSAGLNVDGALVARGTAAAPVYFTSLKDDAVGGDTNGDGSASGPQAGDWQYIYLGTGASASFSYATVRYGGSSPMSAYGNLELEQNSTLAFDHGAISNGSYGIFTYSPAASIAVTNSTIANNATGGMNVSAPVIALDGDIVTGNGSNGLNLTVTSSATVSPTLTLTGDTFTGNASYAAALYFANAGVLDASGNTGSGNGTNGVLLNGTLTTDTLAPNPGLPYVIGGLSVAAGQTLTVAPGAVVKFASGGTLTVGGTLQAQGTAAAPVYFTSLKDDAVGGDTNGDGSASGPQAGDWQYIYLGTGASASFSYATIRYGGSTCCSGFADLYLYGGNTLSVDHSTISNSSYYGIETYRSAASVSVTNSTIANNGSFGIYIAAASATITSSRIYGNRYGLYNADSSTSINAPNNWWGSSSGPAPHGSGNGINYKTCYAPPYNTPYDCQDYVNVYPWIGMSSSQGQSGPSSTYQAQVAEPVNSANGNYSYAHTFLSLPTRGLPLDFALAYNALAPQNGPVGYGWTHTWNVALAVNPDSSITVTFGDGHGERWTPNGSAYVGDPGTFGVLAQNGDGTYDLVQKDYTHYHFDPTGKLLWEQDRNADRTTLAYDAQNRLTTVTAPDGRALSFTYNNPANPTLVTQVTDPLNRTITLADDASGNLASVTDPTGATTTMTYDATHRVLTVTDANNHTFVTNTYDGIGRVSQQLDALSDKTTFVYDDTNHRTLVTDPRGNTTTYQYDPSQRLTAETDPNGHTASYVYDANDDKLQVTDKRGNTTTYTYDARGNVLTAPDPLKATSSFVWDISNGRNNLTSQTDANNHTTTYLYDAHNNPIRKTDALNDVTSYGYDQYGELASLEDANGHTATYGYDSYGDQTSTTDPLTSVSTATFDAGGRKLTETDANHNTATFTYDEDNRDLTITDALNGVTTYAYDAVGNRTRVTDANTHATTYAYDAKDRLSTVTDPLGNVTAFAYDASDNEVALTDPLKRTTTYTYDALNRRLTVVDPLKDTTTYAYDPNGNRIKVTDPNNHATQYAYDADNRLTSVTDANNGTVAYTYDAVGNRLQMTDANGYVTKYTYDALNRLATTTDPMNRPTGYTYDAVGNQLTKGRPDQLTVSYGYDADNRLTSVGAPGLSITQTFDAVGNRVTLVDDTGTTSFAYDALRRLTKATYPSGKALAYGYDAVGNRTSLTYPNNQTVGYTYDADNRLLGVTDWNNRVFAYTYDAAGETTGLAYPNGTAAAYSYDTAGRVSQIADSRGGGALATFGYTYDKVGNRLSEQATSGTTSYAYDPLNRLTSATYPGGVAVGYTYDPMGNRLSLTRTGSSATTYVYDAADQMLIAGSDSYSYDGNGRVAWKQTADMTKTTYSFDALDRLTSISGATTDSYTYNGDGVRVGKAVGSTTTTYVQDLGTPLPVALVETTTGQDIYYVYGKGLLEQIHPDGSRIYYHADALSNIRALTDDNGSVVTTYDYDAFGAVRNQTGSAANTFTFTGEQADGETGLVYLRARYYDPTTGRFVSRDHVSGSIALTQARNPYVYAMNDPLDLVDPSGNISLDKLWDQAKSTAGNAAGTAIDWTDKGLSAADKALSISVYAGSPLSDTIDTVSELVSPVNSGIQLGQTADHLLPSGNQEATRELWFAYRQAEMECHCSTPTTQQVEDAKATDVQFKSLWLNEQEARTIDKFYAFGAFHWLFPMPKEVTPDNDEGFKRWYSSVYGPAPGDSPDAHRLDAEIRETVEAAERDQIHFYYGTVSGQQCG